MDGQNLLPLLNSDPAELARAADEASMRNAFEAEYERDWNAPSSSEMKAIWSTAWKAARTKSNSLLSEALDEITDKPWDDSSYLHARISLHLGREVQYADWIEQSETNKIG